MNYKNLSLGELKSLYSERPGFVFLSDTPSSEESCEKLYKQLKDFGVSEYEPDFINIGDGKTIFFIYPEETSFNSGDLYKYDQQVSFMTHGVFKIDILSAFLKQN